MRQMRADCLRVYELLIMHLQIYMQTVFDQIDSFYRFPLKTVGRVWTYVQKKKFVMFQTIKVADVKSRYYLLTFLTLSYEDI